MEELIPGNLESIQLMKEQLVQKDDIIMQLSQKLFALEGKTYAQRERDKKGARLWDSKLFFLMFPLTT